MKSSSLVRFQSDMRSLSFSPLWTCSWQPMLGAGCIPMLFGFTQAQPGLPASSSPPHNSINSYLRRTGRTSVTQNKQEQDSSPTGEACTAYAFFQSFVEAHVYQSFWHSLAQTTSSEHSLTTSALKTMPQSLLCAASHTWEKSPGEESPAMAVLMMAESPPIPGYRCAGVKVGPVCQCCFPASSCLPICRYLFSLRSCTSVNVPGLAFCSVFAEVKCARGYWYATLL